MSTEQRYSLSGATMGTRYSAVFYAAESIDQGALQAELQQAVDRVDRQMSTWQADSDLMRLSAAPPGQSPSSLDSTMPVSGSASLKARAVLTAS